ncbi:MAG: hypothetical protein HY744_00225 [Deltaproteobacteria bacterium]|nr:hypothetical protein [Deltaproteobacteria bacterium]
MMRACSAGTGGLASPAALGVLLVAAALACGCPGPKKGPGAAAGSAPGERRNVELQHEPCDLGSKGAVSMDANGDGRPEIVKVREDGREICRAVDINGDGLIDAFRYFDEKGQVVRKESGFDRDMRPDEVGYYKRGEVVRKERETNGDGKIDTWDYYQNGRLVREERDSNGDGYLDQWWAFNRPDRPRCAVVFTDADGNGEPDEDSQLDLCGEKEVFVPPPAPTAKPEEAAADAGADAGAEAPAEPPPEKPPEKKPPEKPPEKKPPEKAEPGQQESPDLGEGVYE